MFYQDTCKIIKKKEFFVHSIKSGPKKYYVFRKRW